LRAGEAATLESAALTVIAFSLFTMCRPGATLDSTFHELRPQNPQLPAA